MDSHSGKIIQNIRRVIMKNPNINKQFRIWGGARVLYGAAEENWLKTGRQSKGPIGRRRKIERKSVARARVLYGAAEEN